MTEDRSADMVISTCMGARKGESVLIITDTKTDAQIATSLYDSAVRSGCEAILLKMQPRLQHGAEPPTLVAESMKNADVILAPASKSLTHTKARQNASKKGARTATMPGITTEMMSNGGLTADYKVIEERAKQLLKTLEGSRQIRITTAIGTDLLIDVQNCTWLSDTGICHEKGTTSNLPAGEVYIAPANVNGRLVVDGSMAAIGLLEEPLIIEIKDRYAVSCKGKDAPALEAMVDAAGPEGRNIAELGIGINPEARITGIILEDEKVGGTIHIALGDNSTFGGNVCVDLHLDGIVKDPQVYVDGEKLDVERFGRK